MKFFFIRIGNFPIEKKKNRLTKPQGYKAKHKPKNMASAKLGRLIINSNGQRRL